MKNIISQMDIQKVVIHQIITRESKDNIIPPLYNNTCSELGTETLDALQKRLTKALGNNSHSMKMDIKESGDESVYSHITKFWLTQETDEEFVELSKQMTIALARAQDSRRIPGGVIVVLKGTVTELKKDFIALIKAEKHDGFNITQREGTNLLEYFSNLLLTPQQKLHKIGFYINNAVRGRKIEKQDVEVFVFDSNTSESSMIAHASYFFDRFLGLKFRSDGDYITKKFYIATRDFINVCAELDAMDKISIQSDLITYLETESIRVINPKDFIKRNIDTGSIVDSYLSFVQTQNIPLQDTRKDMGLLTKSIKERKLSFENKIKLQGPSEAFYENVKITDNENGDTIITIKGKYINEK